MGLTSRRTGSHSGAVRGFCTIRKVTIADVAQRAAVSNTTVSHVLSGKRAVAAPTRIGVESAIQELGLQAGFAPA